MSSETNETKRVKEEEMGHDPHDHHRHHGHPRGGWCGGRRRFWFVPLILAAIAVKGALFMLVWNALIPDLFHGPELNYLQSVGLLFLGKMLVGFRGPGGGRFGGHHRHHHKMRGKFWARLSEEERKELRDRLRKRWHEE